MNIVPICEFELATVNVEFVKEIPEIEIEKLVHSIKRPVMYKESSASDFLVIINDPNNFDKFYYIKHEKDHIDKFYYSKDNEWYATSQEGRLFKVIFKE